MWNYRILGTSSGKAECGDQSNPTLQAGIKIGGRNINILRYADDTAFHEEESEEELKSLMMRVKEESEG